MQIGADGRIYVPAKINDQPKSMLVDTGGFFTEITQTAADELKLGARHTRLELIGVTGDTTRRAVRADFRLGSLHADSMDFMLMPEAHPFAPDVPDAAGLLAPNLLRAYDVDLDFGDGKLSLISQKHCDGKVVYWPAEAVAVVPFRLNSSGHIMLPVELDGHRLTAQLDTGSTISLLNMNVAQSTFGLSPGSLDTPARGTLGPTRTYTHKFKSLALEGIAVSNPSMALIPDLIRTKMLNPRDSMEGDTRIGNPDTESGLAAMILGMDVLHRLHVYIAYKEEKLYFTPATASPKTAAVPASATPAAAAGSK
jgi:predicted aspartyl protease